MWYHASKTSDGRCVTFSSGSQCRGSSRPRLEAWTIVSCPGSSVMAAQMSPPSSSSRDCDCGSDDATRLRAAHHLVYPWGAHRHQVMLRECRREPLPIVESDCAFHARAASVVISSPLKPRPQQPPFTVIESFPLEERASCTRSQKNRIVQQPRGEIPIVAPSPFPLVSLIPAPPLRRRGLKRMCQGGARAAAAATVDQLASSGRRSIDPLCEPTPTLCVKPSIAVAVAPSMRAALQNGAVQFTPSQALPSDSDDSFEMDPHTIRARVQRILVQFVMLPVVWVSLCCVITAAVGIECVESLQKVLTTETLPVEDGREDLNDRPTKKTKRDLRDHDRDRDRGGAQAKQAFQKPPPHVIRRQQHDDDRELVHKKHQKTGGTPTKNETAGEDAEDGRLRVRSVSQVLAATTRTTRPRKRRVLIWDLDETLVLFASLYSGQFARTHNKDLAVSVALGEQMMTYLVAVLERHFFFSDLHDADVDHITSVTPDHTSEETLEGIIKGTPQYDRVVADRYARIRAIYERRGETPVDFLDDPASQWFAARQALVGSIDAFSTGWIREARELLALTSSQRRSKETKLNEQHEGGEGTQEDDDDEEEVINVMVTNTQLSPALCKCLIYGLDAYFPIDAVYSSSKLHKFKCFQTIVAKYSNTTTDGSVATPSETCSVDDREVEFIAIGDGAEEEQVSRALGLSFFKIRSLDDLKQLRYELQLAERPQAKTTAAATPNQDQNNATGTD